MLPATSIIFFDSGSEKESQLNFKQIFKKNNHGIKAKSITSHIQQAQANTIME
jgi:hypothetical protein